MGTGQVVPSLQRLEDGVIPAALTQVLGRLNTQIDIFVRCFVKI